MNFQSMLLSVPTVKAAATARCDTAHCSALDLLHAMAVPQQSSMYADLRLCLPMPGTAALLLPAAHIDYVGERLFKATAELKHITQPLGCLS
jgi:hypothetical protein